METKQLPKFVEIVIDGIEQQKIIYNKKSKIESKISKKLYSYLQKHKAIIREASNFQESIKGERILQSQELLSNKKIHEFIAEQIPPKEIFKDIYPLNARVVTILLLMQTTESPFYSEKDFLAECMYFVNQKEYRKVITDIWRDTSIFSNLGFNSIFDIDFNTFEGISRIIQLVASELKRFHKNPMELLKSTEINDKIIELFLSGKQEDWERYRKLNIELPEEMSLKSLLVITIIIRLYIKIKPEEIKVPDNGNLIDISQQGIAMGVFDKVFQMEKEKHRNDYNIWKNYISDNLIIESEINDQQIRILYTLTMIDGRYINILNSYFDIIYNINYSEAYRAYVIKLLKNEEYAAILPYYEEYCKEHNISPDRYYYLGDIPPQNKESICSSPQNEILTESGSTDINRLSMPKNFNNDRIMHLSRLLSTEGFIDVKDINYLSYFLGSSNTTLKKSERINWLGTLASLKYFINQLYSDDKQFNKWKAISNIFVVLSKGRCLKIKYSSIVGLSKSKYENEVDEKKKQLINECINKAVNYK